MRATCDGLHRNERLGGLEIGPLQIVAFRGMCPTAAGYALGCTVGGVLGARMLLEQIDR